MTQTRTDDATPRLILVTGPSGAGRATAIRSLEDIGFEVIDNMPLSLLPRLLEGPELDKPLALGIDVRNRDFSVAAFFDAIARIEARLLRSQVLFLDCSEDVLVRRYSETRRRHPMAPATTPLDGIRRETELLGAVRDRADVLIDTTALSPHELRGEIEQLFAPGGEGPMAVTVHSFSYKRGLPRGLDLAFDCRFLRNPHWEDALRPHDGRDRAVEDYVVADPRFDAFFARVSELLLWLLPAYREEGKFHLSVGFGCTGGQHRSVVVTEMLAKSLAEAGWQVSKRHRELDRRADAGAGQEPVSVDSPAS